MMAFVGAIGALREINGQKKDIVRTDKKTKVIQGFYIQFDYFLLGFQPAIVNLTTSYKGFVWF